MIFGTRPHGHQPRFWSSVTSTPSFFPTIGAKSRRLIHRSMLGIVVDSAPKTVSLSSRSLFHSPSRISTVSLRFPLYGGMACGWRKFQLDVLGDHLCTCTVPSGVKKSHDWVVDQLTDLFCTTQCVRETFIFKYFPLPLVLSTIINNNNMSWKTRDTVKWVR